MNWLRIATGLYTSVKFTYFICSNLQDCGGGNPLGMSNGFIPDEAITSSSETRQNPAHLGRLGEELYWCSGVESESHLEISLSKKQRITSAIVDVVRGQQKPEGVALLAKNGDIWYNLSVEKVMNLLHTF